MVLIEFEKIWLYLTAHYPGQSAKLTEGVFTVWFRRLDRFETKDVVVAIEIAMSRSVDFLPTLPNVLAVLSPPPTALDLVMDEAVSGQETQALTWVRMQEEFIAEKEKEGEVLMVVWESSGSKPDRLEWRYPGKLDRASPFSYTPNILLGMVNTGQIDELLPEHVAKAFYGSVRAYMDKTLGLSESKRLQIEEPPETNDGGVL